MKIKNLFIVDDEKSDDKPKKQESVKDASKTKFPPNETTETVDQSTSTSSFNFGFGKTSSPINTPPSDEHYSKALEIYQAGFDSLNKPGYDFFEFYQAVSQAGIDNPQIYVMAFTMAVGMEKTITKTKLLQDSDYYLTEINKVYNDYIAKGNNKKQELVSQKENENQNLINELNLLKEQLETITVQIKDRENKLQAIGSKYEPKIVEIDSKLNANTLAKNKVVTSIEQVKQGIINNLK